MLYCGVLCLLDADWCLRSDATANAWGRSGTLSKQAVLKLRVLYASHKLVLEFLASAEPKEREDTGKTGWSLFSSKKEKDCAAAPDDAGTDGRSTGARPGKIGAYLDMSLVRQLSTFDTIGPFSHAPAHITTLRAVGYAESKLVLIGACNSDAVTNHACRPTRPPSPCSHRHSSPQSAPPRPSRPQRGPRPTRGAPSVPSAPRCGSRPMRWTS